MPEILQNLIAENRLDNIRVVSEDDDVIGGQPKADGMDQNDNNAIFDLSCTLMFAIEELNQQKASLVEQPISNGYSSTRKYRSGELVFVDGIWYECYREEGVIGKDPRDPINRPFGWASQDIHAPYYWVEIGKYLMLPEIGSPIPLATMQIREGLIKYRNDAQLSATKFWRIAEQNPNLIKNGFIEIADLRANVIRGLDDGKGSDPNRVINSFQADATQKFIGRFNGGYQNLPRFFANGIIGINQDKVYDESFNLINGYGIANNTASNVNAFDSYYLDNSLENRTAHEERVKNIAMYYCCRI